MDLKEFGIGGVVVVGGAVYGISQMGLNDALSEELRHISTVSQQERPAYMDQVTAEFAEAFQTYIVETETYAYAGNSKFSTSPGNGHFIEVVTQDSPVPAKELKSIQARLADLNFCEQAEMTMFTDNGWTYRFSMTDSKGLKIFNATCKPAQPELKLRGMS